MPQKFVWFPTSVPQRDAEGVVFYDGYDAPAVFYLTHYYADPADVHYTSPDGSHSVSYDAHSAVTLYTGGKAKVGRQNLFCINATAGEHPKLPASWFFGDDWSDTQIRPTDLKVGSLGYAGSDGNLWKVLPDNSAQDITINAVGHKHYTATASPVKYKLKIQVNDAVTLDPDVVVDGATNFWVGQYLNFTAGFEPTLPEAPELTANLWVFDGIFVNDHTNANVHTSDDYFKNPANLNYPSAHAWWVAGNDSTQFKSQLKAAFAEGLTFANGQHVTVDAKGLFVMYRPQAHVITTTSLVAVDNQYLFNGAPAPIAVHYDGVYNAGIEFTNIVPISYGSLKWLQVVNFHTNSRVDNNGYLHFQRPKIDGSFGPLATVNALDNIDPYDTGNATWDSPAYGLSLPSENQSMSSTANFSMWLEFKPDGGIWVPLRVVDWNWHGTGIRSGTVWSLTTDPDPDPNPDDADTTVFPSWKHTASNQ